MSPLVTQIFATVSALLVIIKDLLSGRKTEEEARAECLAAGRLILPGTATDELAEHEKDAAAGSIAAAIRGASEK